MAQCARSTTIRPTRPALEVASVTLPCGASNARGFPVESQRTGRRGIGYASHLNHLNPRRMVGDFGGGSLGGRVFSITHFFEDVRSRRSDARGGSEGPRKLETGK